MTSFPKSDFSSTTEFMQQFIGFLFAGSQCNGSCGQGEGDCDNDGECLDGLWCEFDWWWGDDYCRAGDCILLHMCLRYRATIILHNTRYLMMHFPYDHINLPFHLKPYIH